MSRVEQSIGKAGEALARTVLESLGVCQLEKIGTPVTVTRSRDGKRINGAFYGEPCAADFRGVFPIATHPHTTNPETIGQSVMAEVKTVEHNLRLSDFKPHQPGKLTEHADLGGLSLVVWVHSSGVYVLRWPIPGFGPGAGLTPVQAQKLDWRG